MRISTKLSLLDRKFSRSINSTVLLCFKTRKQEGWKTDDYMTLLQWVLLIVEKLYHVTYKECQQTVISITNYKYENHVYWQTVIFTLVIYTNGNDMP